MKIWSIDDFYRNHSCSVISENHIFCDEEFDDCINVAETEIYYRTYFILLTFLSDYYLLSLYSPSYLLSLFPYLAGLVYSIWYGILVPYISLLTAIYELVWLSSLIITYSLKGKRGKKSGKL